jgi:putative ABC transport system permease protein
MARILVETASRLAQARAIAAFDSTRPCHNPDVLRKDLKYAIRGLRKSPGFTAVAVATIALAIGANTAMFSFVDGLFLSPLPYPDADRIVRVLERPPGGGRNGISTLNYLDWAEQNTVFEYLAAQAGWGATLTGEDEPVQIRGQRVSADYFRIYGTTAELGRTFVAGDDEPGNDKVVVLSRAIWENRYGGDPSLVGRTIEFDGEPYTVIGVLGGGDSFDRSPVEVFKPLAFDESTRTRNFHWFGAFAKLKPDVTFDEAQAELDVIGQRISEAYPDSNKDWGIGIDRLSEILVGGQITTAIFVLFAATGFVLLIGCANLASLAVTRGIAREREVALRASLGAGRWRVARQALTENVVIALIGGVLGIAVGYLTLIGIKAMIPPFTVPSEFDIRMDLRVMLFAAGVAVVTGLLFGIAPALQASRTNLATTMRDGGHGSTQGTPGRKLRSGLVVAEVALAFVLLVGAGLLMRSLFGLLDVDPGFDSSNVLTAALPIAQEHYPDPQALNAYLDSIRDSVESVAGVDETALTSALPLQGWGYGMPYQIANREIVDRANRRGGFFKMVSPSYFESLRIRLLSGRFIEETDRAGTAPVMLINQTMANREFEGEDPIGQHILVQEIVPGVQQLGDEIPWEIVGVIADEKINGLDDNRSPGMYVSNAQSPAYGVSLLVRTALDPRSLENSIRDAIESVNPDQAMSQVRTLEQIESDSVVGERIQSILLGSFATLALLLAAIGIYGVIAYAVAQRTQELGVRAALGATAKDLQGLVFRGGMRLTAIGLAIGLVGALALTRVMSSMLFDVNTYDPFTLIGVTLVLAAVAAVACFIPARRATRIDPMVALRYQ